MVGRRARRLLLVLGILAGGGLAAAGGATAFLDELLTHRRAVEAARWENRTLRARQEALRERALDLAARLEALESELAAGRGPTPAHLPWLE